VARTENVHISKGTKVFNYAGPGTQSEIKGLNFSGGGQVVVGSVAKKVKPTQPTINDWRINPTVSLESVLSVASSVTISEAVEWISHVEEKNPLASLKLFIASGKLTAFGRTELVSLLENQDLNWSFKQKEQILTAFSIKYPESSLFPEVLVDLMDARSDRDQPPQVLKNGGPIRILVNNVPVSLGSDFHVGDVRYLFFGSALSPNLCEIRRVDQKTLSVVQTKGKLNITNVQGGPIADVISASGSSFVASIGCQVSGGGSIITDAGDSMVEWRSDPVDVAVDVDGETESEKELQHPIYGVNVPWPETQVEKRDGTSKDTKETSQETETSKETCHEVKEIGDAKLGEDGEVCVVCFDGLRVGCFLPCGHCAACMDCGLTLQVCPLCQGKIANFLHISKVPIQTKLYFS
jgi:hypothetical protein